MSELTMILIIISMSLLVVVVILAFSGSLKIGLKEGWTAGITSVFKFLYRPVV
jgi:hypothetical protein